MNEIRIYPDTDHLARAAAEGFVALAAEAVGRRLPDRGQFSVALAGGSTPRAAYALLAAEEVDWSRVHVFWGDERCVPPDHPDSNYRLAREALLDHVSLPAGNVHRMRGEMEPEAAAQAYAAELRAFFGTQWPSFDLVLLGMGNDGHIASLFPGSAAAWRRNGAASGGGVRPRRALLRSRPSSTPGDAHFTSHQRRPAGALSGDWRRQSGDVVGGVGRSG